MIKSFFEIFTDKYKCVIVALTCTVVCIVGEYRNFGYIKLWSFELSFDFLFFVALVFAIVSWLVLGLAAVRYVLSLIYYKILLKRLKACTPQEKDFLYNRVYQNDNETAIQLDEDAYFFKKVYALGGYSYECYKPEYKTKEQIMKFLRKLENKGIVKNYGNKTMCIPQEVWTILVKNAKEIFPERAND